MSTYRTRQNSAPRYPGAPRPYVPQRQSNPAIPILIGIFVIAAAAGIIWVLKDREQKREADRKVAGMLVSADQFVEANQEDQAEALMKQALGLMPGDPRCQAVLDRIAAKREMIQKKLTTNSTFALEQAEFTAKSDIAGAIEVFERIQKEEGFTAEAKRTAAERIKAFKEGACSLKLPSDWPLEAQITIDGAEVQPKDGMITGIKHGKHTVAVTRFGYREPAALEMDFRGLDTLKYPDVSWKRKGGKVAVKSQPAGAQVWLAGVNTGKVTPCEFEDIDEGEVEFVLKLPKYENQSVKGEVKARQTTRLSAVLKEDGIATP
jgi:hypothetical protein